MRRVNQVATVLCIAIMSFGLVPTTAAERAGEMGRFTGATPKAFWDAHQDLAPDDEHPVIVDAIIATLDPEDSYCVMIEPLPWNLEALDYVNVGPGPFIADVEIHLPLVYGPTLRPLVDPGHETALVNQTFGMGDLALLQEATQDIHSPADEVSVDPAKRHMGTTSHLKIQITNMELIWSC